MQTKFQIDSDIQVEKLQEYFLSLINRRIQKVFQEHKQKETFNGARLYTKYTDLELLMPYSGEHSPRVISEEKMAEIKEKQLQWYLDRVAEYNESKKYVQSLPELKSKKKHLTKPLPKIKPKYPEIKGYMMGTGKSKADKKARRRSAKNRQGEE